MYDDVGYVITLPCKSKLARAFLRLWAKGQGGAGLAQHTHAFKVASYHGDVGHLGAPSGPSPPPFRIGQHTTFGRVPFAARA